MNDDQERQPVLLTTPQKLRLLFECLPFAFFIIVGFLYATVLRDTIVSMPPLLWAFFLALLAALGYQAIKRLRDLFSGVVLVRRDVLEESHRASGKSSNRSSRTYYGQFKRLGRLRVMPNVHFESQSAQEYWVHYSPVSQIVWELEPVD